MSDKIQKAVELINSVIEECDFTEFINGRGWWCVAKERLKGALARLTIDLEAKTDEAGRLRDALEDVTRFTPNDTDFDHRPTRDECLKEMKWFAKQALNNVAEGEK